MLQASTASICFRTLVESLLFKGTDFVKRIGIYRYLADHFPQLHSGTLRVEILVEAGYNSFRTNTFGKGKNMFLLSSAMGKE